MRFFFFLFRYFFIIFIEFFFGLAGRRVFVMDSVTSLLMSAYTEEWSGLEESLFLSVALSFST